jgi:hypothetical protein
MNRAALTRGSPTSSSSAGDRLRTRVAIVPLGAALLVWDQLDASIERDLVCWPRAASRRCSAQSWP